VSWPGQLLVPHLQVAFSAGAATESSAVRTIRRHQLAQSPRSNPPSEQLVRPSMCDATSSVRVTRFDLMAVCLRVRAVNRR